jgi:hypothetical protein
LDELPLTFTALRRWEFEFPARRQASSQYRPVPIYLKVDFSFFVEDNICYLIIKAETSRDEVAAPN